MTKINSNPDNKILRAMTKAAIDLEKDIKKNMDKSYGITGDGKIINQEGVIVKKAI
jgi:hypothetical protein